MSLILCHWTLEFSQSRFHHSDQSLQRLLGSLTLPQHAFTGCYVQLWISPPPNLRGLVGSMAISHSSLKEQFMQTVTWRTGKNNLLEHAAHNT